MNLNHGAAFANLSLTMPDSFTLNSPALAEEILGSLTGHYESYRSSNGKIVAVRYDPKQPKTTARVVNPFEGLAPWWAFGMGGALAVSSLGALLPVRLSSGKNE